MTTARYGHPRPFAQPQPGLQRLAASGNGSFKLTVANGSAPISSQAMKDYSILSFEAPTGRAGKAWASIGGLNQPPSDDSPGYTFQS
jgi:hypothetical protein